MFIGKDCAMDIAAEGGATRAGFERLFNDLNERFPWGQERAMKSPHALS